MDHSGGVGIGQAFGQLQQHRPRVGPAVGPVLCEALAQRRPFDELEGDEGNALASSVAQDLDDVRGVDAFGDLELVLESKSVFWVVRVEIVKQLQGDDLPRLVVAGAPDDAHSALAHLLDRRETHWNSLKKAVGEADASPEAVGYWLPRLSYAGQAAVRPVGLRRPLGGRRNRAYACALPSSAGRIRNTGWRRASASNAARGESGRTSK